MKIEAGSLLISRPAMLDPNFDGTVVLICTHDDHGTVGLTLNRPLDVELEDVLPPDSGLDDAASLNIPLLWGGPVGNDCLHVLSGPDQDPVSVLPVLPGVFFGGDMELVRRTLEKQGQLRFFIGYSGWSPGQLQEELDADSWFVLQGEVDDIWSTDWRLLWERLMAKIDPQFSWMTKMPDDPEVN